MAAIDIASGERSAVQRHGAMALPELVADETVMRETAHLYERVAHHIPKIEWPAYAPLVAAINRLKRQRRALILAHNYQAPEIFHCVADITGDSLELARRAATADADIIVQCGVHFMAETTKLLNPQATVLIPDVKAGCSLAESITGEDVRRLREKHPGVPIVTYVNTSAEVKAESDICCTSSNAVQVVESLGADTVLCIPDEYLARNIASQTHVNVLTWNGRCEVHERFTPEELLAYKQTDPEIEIIAHPECSADVIAISDFSGSTSAMIDHVRATRPSKAMLVTECSMASNIQAELPEVEFVKPCNFCPHMRRITLGNIMESLLYLTHEVTVDEAVAARARQSVERMINLGR